MNLHPDERPQSIEAFRQALLGAWDPITRPRAPLTPQAQARLKLLASLDRLGAGFTLASHHLDQRGAGADWGGRSGADYLSAHGRYL